MLVAMTDKGENVKITRIHSSGISEQIHGTWQKNIVVINMEHEVCAYLWKDTITRSMPPVLVRTICERYVTAWECGRRPNTSAKIMMVITDEEYFIANSEFLFQKASKHSRELRSPYCRQKKADGWMSHDTFARDFSATSLRETQWELTLPL